MKKGRVSADLKKELILYINSYYEKEKGKPDSFAQVSVQKIREIDTKGVDSQKVSVSAPNPQKQFLGVYC
jgi:hypothetical protein